MGRCFGGRRKRALGEGGDSRIVGGVAVGGDCSAAEPGGEEADEGGGRLGAVAGTVVGDARGALGGDGGRAAALREGSRAAMDCFGT